MRFRFCTMFLILAMLVAGQTTWVFAQSLTSGDLAGTVTDPSGARRSECIRHREEQ